MNDNVTPERVREWRESPIRSDVPALCDALEAAWHALDHERFVSWSRGAMLTEERDAARKKEAALCDALDAARGELGAYRRAKGENDERFQIERDTAREERDRLLAALRRYGRHTGGCGLGLPGHTCSCGWDKARRELLGGER